MTSLGKSLAFIRCITVTPWFGFWGAGRIPLSCLTGLTGIGSLHMFERYTERARRVIFFARYEASMYGSTTIETEHLLLGMMREDPNLTTRFLRGSGTVESIRGEIEARITVKPKVSTSIDLPLTIEGKRILAYAVEEAERLN